MASEASHRLAGEIVASLVSWPVTSALVPLAAPTGDTGNDATYASRSAVRTTRRPPIKQDGIEPSLSNSRNRACQATTVGRPPIHLQLTR